MTPLTHLNDDFMISECCNRHLPVSVSLFTLLANRALIAVSWYESGEPITQILNTPTAYALALFVDPDIQHRWASGQVMDYLHRSDCDRLRELVDDTILVSGPADLQLIIDYLKQDYE